MQTVGLLEESKRANEGGPPVSEPTQPRFNSEEMHPGRSPVRPLFSRQPRRVVGNLESNSFTDKYNPVLDRQHGACCPRL
jgi:hypothetical protein